MTVKNIFSPVQLWFNVALLHWIIPKENACYWLLNCWKLGFCYLH